MTGGLYDPLGTDRDEGRRPGRALPRPSAPVAALGLVIAALAALLAMSYLRDTGDRGMPVAVAPIERLPPPPSPVPQAPPAPPAAPSAAPAPTPAGQPPSAEQDVQIENGVRVVRPRRDAPPPAALPAPFPTAAPTAALPSAQGGAVLRVPDGGPVR